MSIQSGIRKGCPISMVLYALCLRPIITSLEETQPGLQIGRSKEFLTVLAYADDVTAFFSQPAVFAKIHQAIRCIEQATEARFSPTKSKALAVGELTEHVTVLGIDFHDQVDIIGVNFGLNLALFMKVS